MHINATTEELAAYMERKKCPRDRLSRYLPLYGKMLEDGELPQFGPNGFHRELFSAAVRKQSLLEKLVKIGLDKGFEGSISYFYEGQPNDLGLLESLLDRVLEPLSQPIDGDGGALVHSESSEKRVYCNATITGGLCCLNLDSSRVHVTSPFPSSTS